MRTGGLGLWTLNGKVPEACADFHRWAAWYETSNRVVQQDDLADGEIQVSTIFLGINHNFSRRGPPILFETMVFGGHENEKICRYATWEQAEGGHQVILGLARDALERADTSAKLVASAIIQHIKEHAQ